MVCVSVCVAAIGGGCGAREPSAVADAVGDAMAEAVADPVTDGAMEAMVDAAENPVADGATDTMVDAVEDPLAPAASVEIGVPAGSDGLAFAPLLPGGELRLQSFGQGGTHVLLGIRCAGLGNRAFVALTLTNSLTLVEVSSPASVRPQLLLCSDARTCDLVPILAMASGLTAPGAERNGLPVRVGVKVRNEAGLAASATQDVVLSTADL